MGSHLRGMGSVFHGMGWDRIRMGSHLCEMGPDFHGMGWDRTRTGSHSYGTGPKIFSWDGMGPDLYEMRAPGPVPALRQNRDGTRS